MKNSSPKLHFGMILGLFLFVDHHAFAAEHKVSQKGKAFSVEELTLAVGDSVTFKNDDDTSHNVFSTSDGNKFNLGIQKEGSESSQKFEKPGVIDIRCAIHPKMKLKVTVK